MVTKINQAGGGPRMKSKVADGETSSYEVKPAKKLCQRTYSENALKEYVHDNTVCGGVAFGLGRRAVGSRLRHGLLQKKAREISSDLNLYPSKSKNMSHGSCEIENTKIILKCPSK
jgi:hypothetical protein